MTMSAIDPESSLPLYLQIADALRRRIEAGDLAPGDSLEPLRDAADTWGVSLHTVRHAYTSLARDGLLEVRRGPGGTRVRPDVETRISAESDVSRLEAFLSEILDRAESEFGMRPETLAASLRDRTGVDAGSGIPRTWIVECSRWQCESHAREVESRYRVEARPWVLEESEGPPPGPAIATYFHFNDLRRSWPRRFAEVSFVDIRVDPRLGDLLRSDRLRLVVCERDRPTARAVVADLLALVPDVDRDVHTAVSEDPLAVIRDVGPDARVLCPPRVWARLGPDARSDPRAVEIRYVFDEERLSEVARDRGWSSRPATPAEPIRRPSLEVRPGSD